MAATGCTAQERPALAEEAARQLSGGRRKYWAFEGIEGIEKQLKREIKGLPDRS